MTITQIRQNNIEHLANSRKKADTQGAIALALLEIADALRELNLKLPMEGMPTPFEIGYKSPPNT